MRSEKIACSLSTPMILVQKQLVQVMACNMTLALANLSVVLVVLPTLAQRMMKLQNRLRWQLRRRD